MACNTQEELADAVGMSRDQIQNRSESMCTLDNCPKSTKIAAIMRPFRMRAMACAHF